MTSALDLEGFDMTPASLESEWVVTIDTPTGGVDSVLIVEAWGCRSKLLDDKDNPNRYWNRPDAEKLHGKSVG